MKAKERIGRESWVVEVHRQKTRCKYEFPDPDLGTQACARACLIGAQSYPMSDQENQLIGCGGGWLSFVSDPKMT